MSQNKKFHRPLSSLVDTGRNVVHLPLVEILSDRRVIIENHNGIVQYETERICVKTREGIIEIQGRGLELIKIGKEQLIITGCIICVSMHNRRK